MDAIAAVDTAGSAPWRRCACTSTARWGPPHRPTGGPSAAWARHLRCTRSRPGRPGPVRSEPAVAARAGGPPRPVAPGGTAAPPRWRSARWPGRRPRRPRQRAGPGPAGRPGPRGTLVGLQLVGVDEGREGGQAVGGPTQLTDGDGSVHRHHGGGPPAWSSSYSATTWPQSVASAVAASAWTAAMAAWIWNGPGLVAAQAGPHQVVALVDQPAVPPGAVLVGQAHHGAIRSLPAGPAAGRR